MSVTVRLLNRLRVGVLSDRPERWSPYALLSGGLELRVRQRGVGWLQLHVGITCRPSGEWRGGGGGLISAADAVHEPHWAWRSFEDAAKGMCNNARPRERVIVLSTWLLVKPLAGGAGYVAGPATCPWLLDHYWGIADESCEDSGSWELSRPATPSALHLLHRLTSVADSGLPSPMDQRHTVGAGKSECRVRAESNTMTGWFATSRCPETAPRQPGLVQHLSEAPGSERVLLLKKAESRRLYGASDLRSWNACELA
jgi:hypothetical protein